MTFRQVFPTHDRRNVNDEEARCESGKLLSARSV